MHVDDVCAAMKLCMERSPVNEIYNIGSGIPRQFGEIMEYVRKKTESKSQFISVEPPDFHKKVQVKDMYLDTTKIRSLGFKPKKDIWRQIDKIINITKERI